jgi:lipopolysaccharide transport protein LptA
MTAPTTTSRIRRYLLIGLILGVGGLGGLYYLGRQGDEPEPVETPVARETRRGDVVASSDAFDFTQAIEGQPVFSIHGDGFSTGRDGRVELIGVRVEIFRAGTRYAVQSQRATYDPNSKEAVLAGAARLEGEDGLKVSSPNMTLTRAGKLLIADGPVGLEQTGRWSGQSARLEFDVAADLLSLGGPVTLATAPGLGPAMQFETGKLDYDRKGRLLQMPDTLVLTRGTDRIQAGSGELFLDEAEQAPLLLALKGGVTGTLLDPDGEGAARRIAVQATRLSVRYAAEGTSQPEEATLEGHGRDLALIESIGADAELIQGLASRAWLVRFAAGQPTEADSTDPVHFAEYRRGVDEPVRNGRADSGRIEFSPGGEVARIALDGGVSLVDPQFKASGDRALFDVPTGRAEILGPRARAESPRGDLTAPHLVYTRSSGLLNATGGVRAVLKPSSDGALRGVGFQSGVPVQVESREATLTDRPRGFVFRDSVRAWQGKNLLVGAQLRGDESEGRLSAAGKVKTVWIAEREGATPVEVTSETLSYDDTARQLIYAGAVTLAQDGRQLACDELTAKLDEGRKIREMTGTGKVRLKDPAGGRDVEGERADYDALGGTVVVSGSPVVMRDAEGAVLKGKRLRYDMNSGAATLLGADS